MKKITENTENAIIFKDNIEKQLLCVYEIADLSP